MRRQRRQRIKRELCVPRGLHFTSPRVERRLQASLDEAYMDITDYCEEHALEVRREACPLSREAA